MMDRGRIDRERENVFEAVRRSYAAAMENTLALQQRTLELARTLLENSAEVSRAQAERNRALLEELAEQTRRQQETLQGLLRGTASAYVNLLSAPFSYYREAVASMTPPVGRRPGQRPVEELAGEPVVERPASTGETPPQDTAAEEVPPQEGTPRDEASQEVPPPELPSQETPEEPEDLPLEDYDSLGVRGVSERLEGLSVEELERLRAYEAANKNRSTLLKRLDTRIKTNL